MITSHEERRKFTGKVRPGHLGISGFLKLRCLKEDISTASEQFVVLWKATGNPLPLTRFSKRWFNLGQLNVGPLQSDIKQGHTHHRNIRSEAWRTGSHSGRQEQEELRARVWKEGGQPLLIIYLHLPEARKRVKCGIHARKSWVQIQ